MLEPVLGGGVPCSAREVEGRHAGREHNFGDHRDREVGDGKGVPGGSVRQLRARRTRA